jgi:hypothetical protein
MIFKKMIHNNKNKILIDYIIENLKSHEIVREYKNNNINKVRVNTYKDFVINLCYYVMSTYLGDEYIKTEKEKKQHFKWCFDKVCKEFIEENIDYTNNKELFDYFYEYFNSTLYENEMYDINFIIDYWEETLDYSFDKTKSTLDGLIEIYSIFDRSIEDKIKDDIHNIPN